LNYNASTSFILFMLCRTALPVVQLCILCSYNWFIIRTSFSLSNTSVHVCRRSVEIVVICNFQMFYVQLMVVRVQHMEQLQRLLEVVFQLLLCFV